MIGAVMWSSIFHHWVIDETKCRARLLAPRTINGDISEFTASSRIEDFIEFLLLGSQTLTLTRGNSVLEVQHVPFAAKKARLVNTWAKVAREKKKS
jgi:hypothetical protein